MKQENQFLKTLTLQISNNEVSRIITLQNGGEVIIKKMKFYKYQGVGNDFVMIDNRNKIVDRNDYILIERLCDRRFGIGADGLILIENHTDYDFEMIYFNADGHEQHRQLRPDPGLHGEGTV